MCEFHQILLIFTLFFIICFYWGTALGLFSRGVCSSVLDGDGTPLHGLCKGYQATKKSSTEVEILLNLMRILVFQILISPFFDVFFSWGLVSSTSFYSILEPIVMMLNPVDLTGLCGALVQHGPIVCKQRCACAFTLLDPIPPGHDSKNFDMAFPILKTQRTYSARDWRPKHVQ